MGRGGRTVEAEIQEVDLDSEDGRRKIAGVRAICTECGVVSEAYGTGEESRKRALAGLRESCGMGERNFYVEADGGTRRRARR